MSLHWNLAACLAVFLAESASAQCPPQTVADIEHAGSKDGDQFGAAAALAGDTSVVGAPLRDAGALSNAGAAYVFQENAGGPSAWGQVAKLTAFNKAAGDRFGVALSISGDTIVVGAPRADRTGADSGAAYVFERNQGGPNAWGLVTELAPTGGAAAARFGTSVGVSGSWIVVGASGASVSGAPIGAAYVFERDQGGANVWGEVTRLLFPQSRAIGRSVAINGDDVVVGSLRQAQAIGMASVFERNAGGANAWGHVKDIQGVEMSFGESLALSADVLLIGAPDDDSKTGTASGLAYLHERNAGGPGAWGAVQTIAPWSSQDRGRYGASVAATGDVLLVGAPFYMEAWPVVRTGMVDVLRRDWGGPGVWSRASLFTPGQAFPEEFGASVAISGDDPGYAVVGAPKRTNPFGTPGGARMIYFPQGSAIASYCPSGTSASGCSVQLAASGIASASDAWGFDLIAFGVEGAKDGQFFYGVNGRQQNAWGNGTSFQCVVPPVVRAGLLVGVGTSGTCEGFFRQDLNTLWDGVPAKNPGVGALVQAQLWYRDPLNTSNRTTSLSDAIEFTVCP